jgi:hypothetical protein
LAIEFFLRLHFVRQSRVFTSLLQHLGWLAKAKLRDPKLGPASPLGFRRGVSAAAPRRLERVKGIEPSSSAWKAVALPLSYTRFGTQKFGIRVSEHGLF